MTRDQVRATLEESLIGKEMKRQYWPHGWQRVTGIEDTGKTMKIKTKYNPLANALPTMYGRLWDVKTTALERTPGWTRITVYGAITCYSFIVRDGSKK